VRSLGIPALQGGEVQPARRDIRYRLLGCLVLLGGRNRAMIVVPSDLNFVSGKPDFFG
jgi:hypothetical protein